MKSSLYLPELVMPEQFYETGLNPSTGELALMLAVLKDGLLAYAKNINARDPGGKLLYHEARIWIEADDEEYPFSFVNICTALDLDPSYLRKNLRDWALRKRKKETKRPRIASLKNRRDEK